jgi:hypothetical protein
MPGWRSRWHPPDAIFIGQYDLALSLGSLPQSDKRVIDGVQKIFDSAKKAGVPVIAWSPGDEAKAAVEQGYEGIMVGLDMSVLTKAFAGELAAAGAPKRWWWYLKFTIPAKHPNNSVEYCNPRRFFWDSRRRLHMSLPSQYKDQFKL